MIPDTVLKRLLSIFEKDIRVEKAYLFGSWARGDNRYNSDIDIAILGNHVSRSIKTDLNEASGLYTIDIVDLNDDLDESFLEEIKEDMVMLYSKEELPSENSYPDMGRNP